VLDRHGLGALRCSPSPRERHEHAGGIVDGGSHNWSIRVSLALMALGMAYMLATTYGTVTTSAISGMQGMTSPMP
jgi:hypothetical protein